MHFLVVSLRKDWARVRRDPLSLLTALGIPLVLAVLMSLVFGRDPVTPRGLLLVTDEDGSIGSNRLLDGFHRDPLDKMLTIERVARDTGQARMDRGEASAFLLIPKGFQQAFLMNLPFRLELFTNPAQRIVPRIIEEALSITVETAFYVRRGAPMTVSHPLIEIETEEIHERSRAVSFAATFLPSMLFMGLLFIANSTAADIWKERTSGTLRRMASSPVSMASYLAARVVFVAMVYAVIGIAGLVAAQRLAGMPAPHLAAATLWIMFSGTVFYLLFLGIAVQPATPRAASVLANLIIFPLAMLGGSFFPFEWMPAWMASVGRLTPNGVAISQFKALLSESLDAAHLIPSALVLAALGGLAFYLTLRRLRHGFAI